MNQGDSATLWIGVTSWGFLVETKLFPAAISLLLLLLLLSKYNPITLNEYFGQ